VLTFSMAINERCICSVNSHCDNNGEIYMQC
jgi:hypothetical protein